jgi:hypothetical protein
MDNYEIIRSKYILSVSTNCHNEIKSSNADAAKTILESLVSDYKAYEDTISLENVAKLITNYCLAFRKSRITESEKFLALLKELWQKNKENAVVCISLARCYGEMYIDAERNNKIELADSLIGKIRLIYSQSLKEASVREDFSTMLFNRCVFKEESGNIKEMDATLDELRGLKSEGMDVETAINLAGALVQRTLAAEKQNNLELFDEILAEIRELVCRYPDDYSIGFQYTQALCNRILDANELITDQRLSTELKRELLRITRNNPEIDRKLRDAGWTPPYGLFTPQIWRGR